MSIVSAIYALVAITSISDCGTDPLFKITSQSFIPDSPKTGDNTTWSISFTVPDCLYVTNVTSVNSGLINGFLPIDTSYTNMCDQVGCPAEAGDYTITNWQIWPDGLAGTKVALTSQWVDQYNNELLCSKAVVVGQRNSLRH